MFQNTRDKNLLLWCQMWKYLYQNFHGQKIINFDDFDFL